MCAVEMDVFGNVNPAPPFFNYQSELKEVNILMELDMMNGFLGKI